MPTRKLDVGNATGSYRRSPDFELEKPLIQAAMSGGGLERYVLGGLVVAWFLGRFLGLEAS